LQALALAQGFTAIASPGNAMIIRQPPGDPKPIQIAADLKQIINGKKPDVELLPDDILLVPTSVTKNTLAEVAKTAIRATTSVLIYRGF
jgi:hypothetical protein